jgi:DNA-binding transcriptional MerR regulator
MKRTDGEGPNVFLEIQGYGDDMIYWRAFREVCIWHEDNKSEKPFILIILFIDEQYDPDNCMLSCKPPCRLIRKNLADCLKGIGKKAGVLTVLKPLLLSGGKKDRAKLPELVPQWEEEIRSAELPEDEEKEAAELLICAVMERFSDLTLEEVKKMIQLTPLDQTVAGRELIQIGRDQGRTETRKETARNLLSIGKLTAKEIARATGLSLKEVKALLNSGKRTH